MRRVQIDKDIALTTIALGDSKRGVPAREAGAFAIMDKYIDLGGNTFDSARVYDGGACDEAMGRWLAARPGMRSRIHIVTKGSHPDPSSMFVSRLSRAEIEGDLDASLLAMGIEYSDLHLLHRDDVKIPVSEIMPSLDALVRAGKTRAVGVSNWSVGRIIEANRFALENGLAPIRCCQLHYSLALTTAPITGDITHVPMNDIEFGWYRESQLPVMCFGAQARGWFAARAAGKEPTESPLRYYDILPENHRRLTRLRLLAERMRVPLAAITTAYVRDHGLNAVALCSYSTINQMEESFAANAFRLTTKQIRYLDTGVGAVDDIV